MPFGRPAATNCAPRPSRGSDREKWFTSSKWQIPASARLSPVHNSAPMAQRPRRVSADFISPTGRDNRRRQWEKIYAPRDSKSDSIWFLLRKSNGPVNRPRASEAWPSIERPGEHSARETASQSRDTFRRAKAESLLGFADWPAGLLTDGLPGARRGASWMEPDISIISSALANKCRKLADSKREMRLTTAISSFMRPAGSDLDLLRGH